MHASVAAEENFARNAQKTALRHKRLRAVPRGAEKFPWWNFARAAVFLDIVGERGVL
jgi:hypothetical protein